MSVQTLQKYQEVQALVVTPLSKAYNLKYEDRVTVTTLVSELQFADESRDQVKILKKFAKIGVDAYRIISTHLGVDRDELELEVAEGVYSGFELRMAFMKGVDVEFGAGISLEGK